MRKIVILSSMLILMISLSACSKKEKEAVNVNPENNSDIAGEEKALKKDSFDVRVSKFNEVYKKALLSTGQENAEEAAETTKEAFNLWIKIFNDFVNNQPKEYRATKDWIEKMKSLSSLVLASESMVEKGELKEAHEKLEIVRKNLKELRVENKIRSISDDMLTFHNVMEEVIAKKSRAEAESKMADLKISFTILKEYNEGDVKYEEMIKKLENVISEVDTSIEENFKEKRDKLKPAFIALYMLFG